MKKILISIMAAMLVTISCIACTGAPATLEMDSTLPWYAYRTFVSEKSRYNVTKYFMKDVDDKIAVTEDSYLEYTLTQSEDEGKNILYTLTANFKIKYTDSEYLDDSFHNKTDTITSTAVFRRDNLAAVYTEKTVTLETDPSSSYSFTVDYTEGTAHFTSGETTKDLTFEKASYIDNEYLYYYIRAMKNLGNTFSANFTVVNWYDCFIGNNNNANWFQTLFGSNKKIKFKTTSMTARFYQTDNIKIENADFLAGFAAEGKDSAEQTLKCNTIQIMLSGTKTGSPLFASYASTPYETTDDDNLLSTKKILAEMHSFEYTTRGTLTYRIDYILNDFTQDFE
ncbi:MAG: hypothetical protein J1F36_01775 [Clostridiales bacterium]|nr:hypothetical protein [Clostridiales bacterium]